MQRAPRSLPGPGISISVPGDVSRSTEMDHGTEKRIMPRDSVRALADAEVREW